MKCLLIAIFLLLIGGSALSAQQPVITPDMQADDSTLRQWLHSDDPRFVAWAADFARRAGNTTIIAEMPDVLEHAAMPPDYEIYGSESEQRRALSSILDALIQSNAPVPISTIRAVEHAFPAQAAILISRLPLSESGDTLRDWTTSGTGPWFGRLARIATMLLAKDPRKSPDFFVDGRSVSLVSNIVAASGEGLDVTIKARNTKDIIMGTGDCGDSPGTPLASGWPGVFVYDLEEHINSVDQPYIEIVNLDGDRIISVRHQSNLGWGACGDVDVLPLDSVTRHRLIAYWLGVRDKDMAWQATKRFTIVWAGKPAYEQRLGEIVETERAKLRGTVRALQGKGLLPDGESAPMPQLVVDIRCDISDINPCPLK